jgi:hypothetical protein
MAIDTVLLDNYLILYLVLSFNSWTQRPAYRTLRDMFKYHPDESLSTCCNLD